uniref:BIG2 domain-containing protein n=1 Tax=Setaria digitata TaxID=48799 RepID=A0A915PVL8_9BILA
MFCHLLLWVLLWYIVIPTCGYRLNVPRVLLPYHPSVQVTFNLVVSDPADGCFTWRSTRPDTVAVKGVNPVGTRGCSAKAQIATTSKYAEEQMAVVFAEDKDAGVVLSCGVTVDVIRSISISTTTKVLFLDASPAKVVVQAYNAEGRNIYIGDMFTNLGEIPFEWHLESSALSEKPLRVVPFSQSKYEAPDGVRLLEENKKRGYVILVEGISTGAATLKVRLVEPHFKSVEAQKVDFIVVANLLLIPSQDIFLPLGSHVHYTAEIVKQSVTEAIHLPSTQYQLQIKDQEICSLNASFSTVTAINYGTTEISLIDRNVKLSTLKPPSARIHVVEPSSLYIRITGDLWYLEIGHDYDISIIVTDADNNIMYIPENAVFKSDIPEEYFKIINKSHNGSYFNVRTLKSGTVKLRAAFISVISPKKELWMSSSIKDEVTAVISDPIEVIPSFITFPYVDAKKIHSKKLLTRGGTGSFIWSSMNPEVVSVDSSGILLTGNLGETEVIAQDMQNGAHFGKAIIQILRPTGISFGKSHVEAEVGSDLILYVSFYANSGSRKVDISDCRRVDLSVKVKDSNIFRITSDKCDEVSSYGDGCCSLVLTAVASGDTTATVQFGNMSASIQISAYLPLKLEIPTEVLVMLGSSFVIRTSGGPRPWFLDPSKYYSKLIYSDASNLISNDDVSPQNEGIIVACKGSRGDVAIVVAVGNEASPTNPLPAKAETKIRICCGVPTRLSLTLLRRHQSKCPTNVRAASCSQPSTLAVSAFGHCESGPSMGLEKQLYSLNSLKVSWKISNKNIAHVEEDKGSFEISEIRGVLKPRNIMGVVEIVASADRYKIGNRKLRLPQELQSRMQADLVENPKAMPSIIVLLNEKRASKAIRLEHGSGHFALVAYDSAVLDAELHSGITKVHPLTVGKSELQFMDLCLDKNFTATISVTDVEEILIEGPEFIALNSEQELQLKVCDMEGLFFVTDDADIMDVQLNASSDILSITRVDALHYILRGDIVGVVTLRASARRANGRILQSQSHNVQVYARLQLLPKIITLVPGSVFQLEISGGPQPLPAVQYHLNNTSVAVVGSDGLVTSKAVGYAKIIASVNPDNGAPAIEDQVIIKTVSLMGVRIHLSTSRIEVGQKAWARVNGLNEDESPFSFGGALHPLTVSWRIATPGILEVVSPIDILMAESPENRFQIELKALAVGQAVIHVTVGAPTNSKIFFKEVKHYDDQIIVTVIEPLQLTVPLRYIYALRLSPDAELDLKSNRKDGVVQFLVPPELSTYMSVIGDNNSTLRGHTVGDAALILKEAKDPHRELIYLPVSITPVASLHMVVKCSEAPEKLLAVLPLGYRLHVDIESRDHLGRPFDAAKHSINYRPHRFDLTEIHPGNANTSFDIYLKDVGETVFKVWDRNNAELAVFLRLPVNDVIEPPIYSVVLSEIICFKSPFPMSGWKELTGKRYFQFINEKNGIAIAVDVGNAVIASYDSHKQTIFSKRKVSPAKSLRFSSVPQFVSNIRNQQYLFPVIVDNTEQNLSNTYGFRCSPPLLEKLTLNAPFDCTVTFVERINVLATSIFVIRSAFLPSLGKYGCILVEQTFEESFTLIQHQSLALNISAVWNRINKVSEASVTITFYSRFEVMQREIRLNNVNALEADLVIHSPASIANKISIESDSEGILRIKHMKSPSFTELRYLIQLDMNSVLLWKELLDKCSITVKSAVTGQFEIVPVTIVLHGDTSKTVLLASDSLMGVLRSFLESTVVQIFVSLLTAAAIVGLLAYCKGYSFPSYLFSSTYSSDPSSTYGTFASDYLERYSALAYVNGKNTMDSPNMSPLSGRSSRSAGSPGEPILWSVPDRSLTTAHLRKRHWI